MITVASVEYPEVDCRTRVIVETAPDNLRYPSALKLSTELQTLTPPFTTPFVLSATLADGDGVPYDGGVIWEYDGARVNTETSTTLENAMVSAMTNNNTLLITPRASGTHVVKATSRENQTLSKTCVLVVTGRLTGITPSQGTMTMTVGETGSVSLTLTPANALDKDIKWIIDDTVPETEGREVISVTGDVANGIIQAKSPGRATIKVYNQISASSGGEGSDPPTLVEANIFVVVKKATQSKVTTTLSPTTVSLDPSSSSTSLVTAAISSTDPTGATTSDTTFDYDITPTGLFSARQNGNQFVLSPIAPGEAKLTVYPKDKPESAATALVFVGGALRELSATGGTNALSVDVGETATVSVTFNPANTHQKNVTWTSSNPSVAEVFGGGTGSAVISGLTAGNTIVTCQSVANPEVKHINTPSLEVLNLSNNKLGLYAGKTCPTCEGRNQAANATTYSETESQNREQPLRSIRIDWLPNLKDINLSNNHLRAGLSAGGKTTNFIISALNLQKINIQGNHIGNNYAFVNRNGTINRLPASSTYNANGMSLTYDQGGCFYVDRSWYDYWDWFLQHKTGYNYWIGKAYIY